MILDQYTCLNAGSATCEKKQMKIKILRGLTLGVCASVRLSQTQASEPPSPTEGAVREVL